MTIKPGNVGSTEISCEPRDNHAMSESQTTDARHALPVEPCEANSKNSEEFKFGHGGPRVGAGRPPKRPIEAKPSGPRWYVIQTAPSCERRVVRDLLEGEDRPGFPHRPRFEVELPIIAVSRKRNGVWAPDHVVMFAGYAFVRFDRCLDDWQSIRHCDGVVQLFATRSMTPIPLPVGFVEMLVKEAPDRLKLQAARMDRFKPGSRLQFENGPMAGFPARCHRCDGKSTEVDVAVLGRPVRVTVPRASLSLVSAS